MATKKANGEGSISKYRDGWRGQLTIGRDDEGKLIRKVFYGKTKKEVDLKLQEYKIKMNIGDIPTDDKITLEQWFYTWLFEFRINDLKPSTFERYEGIYRNYVHGSTIGKMKLVDLRTTHIQKYFNSLLERGMAPNSVSTIKRYLSTCLNESVKQGYLNKNYCTNTKLPKVVKEDKITVLSAAEQKAFLSAINGHELKVLYYMALGTGLRQGELLALKWSDIDFNKKEVSVSKSIKKVTVISKDGTRKGKVLEQTPKTETSNRIVPIPDNIILALKEHNKKQKEIMMKNREIYSNMNYIFANDYGLPLDSKKPTRNLQSILKKLEINKLPFHALRHTYATRLFEADVSPKTVQKLMGHSKLETTMNIYTHVMPEEKQKSVDKINNLFAL